MDGMVNWAGISIEHYWVPIYFSGSIFLLFWVSCEECQFRVHVYGCEKTSVIYQRTDLSVSEILHYFCRFFPLAFALNFLKRWVESLFGPYFIKIWVPIVMLAGLY